MRSKAEKAAFEAAIAEDPYDGVTRKVFADWLEEHGFDDESVIQRDWTVAKHRAAEEWLAMFAGECGDSYDVDEDEEELEGGYTVDTEELIRAAHGYLNTGEWFCLGTMTPEIAMSDDDMELFWQHFMVVSGRPVPTEQRKDCFIACAC